jgi:hypothetical protein
VSELRDQPYDEPADSSPVATETRPAELDDTARAEPMSRDEYADDMRQGPAADSSDEDDQDDEADGYQTTSDDPDAGPQETTRDEYADDMRQGPSAETEDGAEKPEPADDRSDEQEPVGEPDVARDEAASDAQGMTRDEYAEHMRQQPAAETSEPGDNGTRAETHELDTSDSAESAETEQPPPDPVRDSVTAEDLSADIAVVHLQPEDRTLGDTTPTGIGLKPTGEQLLRMEGDRGSILERFRRNVYDRADDITDSGDEYGDDLGRLFQRPPTETHTEMPVSPQSGPAHQDHAIDGGHVANAAFVTGLVAYEAFRHVRNKIEARRKP